MPEPEQPPQPGQTAGLCVALLGGECSGKSTLAHNLVNALPGTSTLAHEQLRTWCAVAGRSPQAAEQRLMAWRQALAIRRAQRRSPNAWVIADTTPLLTAAYSEHYFGDTGLYPAALAFQRRHCGITLLMGLDLPWTADPGQRDGPSHRSAVDGLLRRALDTAGLPYQVIYGQGGQRLQRALQALGLSEPIPTTSAESSPTTARRGWRCQDCLDPTCEHRLFTGLTHTNATGSNG